MNQLKCEMCGSTDIIKQDGVYVCRVCGTKYSVEEAKKMMIEGTVDVQGTVKVDTSDELSNLYQIARRAKNDNNSENAAKYYDMILIKDPTSWEASFYLVYFKALSCTIAKIRSAAVSVSNCLDTVLSLIKEHVQSREEQISAVKDIKTHCLNISSVLYHAAKNHYDGIGFEIRDNYTQEMVDNCFASLRILYNLGDYVEEFFGDYEELHKVSIESWRNGIDYHFGLMKYLVNKELNKEEIEHYAQKIQKYDSSYKPPQVPETKTTGGCYVATCVYGSYDCPEVWTLRRYRDSKLGSSHGGRAFIRIYYAISPTLVKWFGNTKWFKKMWRGVLDKKVKKLQAQGYESTPYNDIDWRKK